MIKATIDLALPVVIEETENVLDSYPFYRKAFANPDLCQKLFAYILSHLPDSYRVILGQTPSFYMVTGNTERTSASLDPYCSEEQRLCIKALIHQGILYLLKEEGNHLI